MKNDLEEKGRYEIYETTEGNELLQLGNNEIFAIVETNQGHILVRTDEDHQKEKSLQKGQYYLVNFVDDPTFQDRPYMFLEEGKKFQELILPRGLPLDKEKRKKVIFTEERVDKDKILSHLHSSKEQVLKQDKPEELEKKELDRMARKLNIEGRSKMTKKELSKAIKKEDI